MKPKAYALACLYSGTPPAFDFDELVDGILLDKILPLEEMQVLTRQEGRFLSIDFGRHFILQVTIHYDRMPAENLAIALQGAKATAFKNDFGPLISEHNSHIVISTAVEAAQKENTMARRLRLYAMQMVAEFLYHYGKPVVVYSDLAQSLTLPASASRSYVAEFDSGIFEQAVLSARGGSVGSGVPIGAHAWGGEDLIGKPVVFRPVNLPSWAVTRGVTRFFAYCDQFGIPANGTTFKDENDRETYRVEHLPRTANYPLGHVEVIIERNLDAEEMSPNGSPVHPELMGSGQRMRPREERKKQTPAKRRYSSVILVTSVTLLLVAVMVFLQGK